MVDYDGETILGLPSLQVVSDGRLELNSADGTATIVDPASYDWYETGQIVVECGQRPARPPPVHSHRHPRL